MNLSQEIRRGSPGFLLAAGAILGVVLIMAGAFHFGIWLAIAGLAGLAAILLFVPNYRICFLFLVCLIPHLGEVDEPGPLPWLWMVPFWLVAVSLVFHSAFRPREVTFEPKFTVTYIFYIVACVLSILLGLSPTLIPDFLDILGLGYQRAQEALMATAFGLFAMSAIQTRDDIARLCWTIVIVGIPYAITLFFFGPEIEPDGRIPRRSGFYLDVHPAAFHMQFTLLMAVALLRSGVQGWKRWALIGCCLLFLSTHNMTNARSVQATIPAIIVLAVILEGKGRYAFLVMLGLGLTFVLFLPIMPENLRSNFLTIVAALTGGASLETVQFQQGEVNLRTFSLRLEHIKWGLETFWQNPWFGVGLGKHPWVSQLPEATTIHCYYVAVLADTGIVGFTLYSAIVAGSIYRGVVFMHRMKDAADPIFRYFTESLLLVIFSALIVFLSAMGNAQGERYIWFAMGLIVVLPAIASRKKHS